MNLDEFFTEAKRRIVEGAAADATFDASECATDDSASARFKALVRETRNKTKSIDSADLVWSDPDPQSFYVYIEGRPHTLRCPSCGMELMKARVWTDGCGECRRFFVEEEEEERMMKTRTNIIIRFTFEAIHYWPDAPVHAQESYLRHPHRHLFHVEARRTVRHDDRDVEFIALRREMRLWCESHYPAHHAIALSCEAIARECLTRFNLSRCAVFEDGENGAEIERVDFSDAPESAQNPPASPTVKVENAV